MNISTPKACVRIRDQIRIRRLTIRNQFTPKAFANLSPGLARQRLPWDQKLPATPYAGGVRQPRTDTQVWDSRYCFANTFGVMIIVIQHNPRVGAGAPTPGLGFVNAFSVKMVSEKDELAKLLSRG